MEQLIKTLADVSISASALCVLILLARLVIGRRPSALLPLLGALLIVRLAVPVMIPSSLSVLNLFGGMDTGQALSAVTGEPSLPDAGGEAAHAPQYTSGAAGPVAITPANEMERSGDKFETAPAAAQPLSAMEIAAIVWLAGVAALSAGIALSNIRFSRRLRKNRPYGAAGFDGLLEECKNELGINRGIRAVQLSGINTAAVYGTIRPRLLISPSFGWLSTEEKRHVLLHELAHIKRRDTLLCLLITALNIAYWFNPLVWAALRLVRGDMEIMCDMTVLKTTGDRKGYAATLLRLAQSVEQKPRIVTALYMRCSLGLFISTAIKRRIKMITRYKKSSALYTCLALVLVIAIAVVGCTGPAAETSPAPTAANTPQASNTDVDNKEQKLIAEFSLDISGLPGNEARQANIEKAAGLLDGMVFPAPDETQTDENLKYTWVDMETVLGDMTEQSGWRSAPVAGAGFCAKALGATFVSIDEKGTRTTIDPKDITDAEEADGAGGGAELVNLAVFKALSDAGMASVYKSPAGYKTRTAIYCTSGSANTAPNVTDKYMERMRTGAMNDICSADIVLGVKANGNTITASLYSSGDVTLKQSAPGTTGGDTAADPNGWRAKFADKFTDGAVEQNENSYKSANLSVSINKVQENEVTYFVADIYVAEPKYFKTAFPKNSDKMGGREGTDVIAQDVSAILVINGDHCVDNPGPVVRNGNEYRLKEKAQDALVMNYDGSMQAYGASELDMDKIKSEGAYQVWTFGPMLLKDGQPMTEFDSPQNINGKNPRTAVGYYEPGHYCFVVVDGRQPGYSDGMDMAQLSQLFAGLGCKVAFNLDGGQSSEMAFMGKLVNQPYNGGRSTTDILYVAEQ